MIVLTEQLDRQRLLWTLHNQVAPAEASIPFPRVHFPRHCFRSNRVQGLTGPDCRVADIGRFGGSSILRVVALVAMIARRAR